MRSERPSSFTKFTRAIVAGTGGSVTPGPGTAGPGGTPVPTVNKAEGNPDFGTGQTGNAGASPLVKAGPGPRLFIPLLPLGLVLALHWWPAPLPRRPPVAPAVS